VGCAWLPGFGGLFPITKNPVRWTQPQQRLAQIFPQRVVDQLLVLTSAGWWFEQTQPSLSSKLADPPNHQDLAVLAKLLEDNRDNAASQIKQAVSQDPSLLIRDGLYEEVETSGHRSYKGLSDLR
jgi:hypothetical protein